MSRQALEVADIFRHHGHAWRQSHRGHISLGQLKVMSAIESCRRAELGGHILYCQSCDHQQIAYNSCRNRHCPKCQATAALRWREARQTELLPVDYYHLVFTLPSQISELAYQNKAVIYNILFKASAETLLTIAKDPKHLGAQVGVTFVLHTWGSAMMHHPHVHGIVPGGGLSLDGQRWVTGKKGFFLHIRVLSRLFRRLFLEKMTRAYQADQLKFFGGLKRLQVEKAFMNWIDVHRHKEWVVYAKRPFAGPKAVLAYLSRYTHRVAIANSRLISMNEHEVVFKWKDYRLEGADRFQSMSLTVDEFIRRFLIHVLPGGFHRIRHYGLIANAKRKDNLNRARELLKVPEPPVEDIEIDKKTTEGDEPDSNYICPDCGAPMIILETFMRCQHPRAPSESSES
ncbi:MAG: IS91 family transposase [Gammaproteobacteria bacterium]|nr:IS91 family transposase [Gammaproteobacteria bacterium]